VEGSGREVRRYRHDTFLEELRKAIKTTVRIGDVPAEIRTKYLPNTSPKAADSC
jgi:hypothetical protein